MKTYTVHAVRVDGWWGLTVPQAPGAVSQVRSLAQAEEYVREAIAFVAGADPDSFAVTIVPQLPAALADRVAAAKQAAADAEQAQATAASLSRAVVAELAEAGFNGRESAVILGLSKQRISQLAATRDRSRPRRVTGQQVVSPRTPTDPDTATTAAGHPEQAR